MNPTNTPSLSLSDPRLLGTLSILGLSLLLLGKKWLNGGVNSKTADLTGKTIVITGSSAGIGKETARVLASQGATIVMACRDEKKTLLVIDELQNEFKKCNISFLKLDLSDLSSVRQFVVEFKKKHQNLHILINNAGIMALPERRETKDGFEMQFGTNHLGPFLLTNLLMDVIKKSAPARIINVSARGHYYGKMDFDDIMSKKSYGPTVAYFQSKLANVMFAKELNRRLEGSGVKAVSVHPGSVRTELFRYLEEKWYQRVGLLLMQPVIWYTFKSALQGAQTSLYCAMCEFGELRGGEYYADCKVEKMKEEGRDEGRGRKLWEVSEGFVGQKFTV